MRGTVVSSSHDLVLVQPEGREVGQVRGTDRLDRSGGRVDNGDSRVVSSEGQGVATGRERNAMDPAASAVRVLATDSVEGELLTPRVSSRPNSVVGWEGEVSNFVLSVFFG